MASAEPDFARLAASRGLKEASIKTLLDEDIDSQHGLSALNLDDINALGLKKAQTKILTAWVEETGGKSIETDFHMLASSKGLKEPAIKVLLGEDFDTVQSVSLLTLNDINDLKLTRGQTKLLIAWVEEIKIMASSEPDFVRLAASKGLKEASIKPLLDEDIDSQFVLSALNLDDINALELTKAQTKILTAWVEERGGRSIETGFHKLASSKGLKEPAIKVLLDEDFDTVQSVSLLTLDDINDLKLRKAQAKLLVAWVEEIKRGGKTEKAPQDLPQFYQHTKQESESAIVQDEEKDFLSREERNPSKEERKRIPTPLNVTECLIKLEMPEEKKRATEEYIKNHEPDFPRLAASKGLKEASIKALLDEDIDSQSVMSALNLDNINALGLTKAQTKILTAWVEETGGRSIETDFHKLASSKGLQELTIQVLLGEDFDTVQSMSLLTLNDINDLKLREAQAKLLVAWVEEIKRAGKTEKVPQDLPQFYQHTEQESESTIVQDEEKDFLSRKERNPSKEDRKRIPTPLNITECLKNLEMPEEKKRATEEYIKNHGIVGLNAFLQSQLDDYKNCPVNIAITGASGMGKSSLINSMRGVKPGAKDAAATGITETTMEPNPYAHPDMTNVVFWDLPGLGTKLFKNETYVESLNIGKNYDALIICSSVRFTQNEVMLANVSKKAEIPFYIVRTKIDVDIKNEMHDKGDLFNEETVLKKIRHELKASLKEQELRTDMVFLVSTHDPINYDTPKFIDELIQNAPEKKKTAMIMSLTNLSENGIAQKMTELKKRIPDVIMLLISQSTKDELRVILDNELSFITQQLNLTKDCVDKLGIRTSDLKLKSLFQTIRMGINPESRTYAKFGITLSVASLGIFSLIDSFVQDSPDQLTMKFTKFLEDSIEACANASLKMIQVAMKKAK